MSTYKLLFYGIIIPVFVFLSYANGLTQSLAAISSHYDKEHCWIKLRDDISITPSDLLTTYKTDLGLSDQDILVEIRKEKDELGFTHYRFQQYHQGIKVDGGVLLVHMFQGRINTVNGQLISGLQVSLRSQVPEYKVIESAMEYIKAEEYLWEDPNMEAHVKKITGNPYASYFPEPELILFDPTFEGQANNYKPVFKVLVHARKPAVRSEIYIDAYSGQVIQELDVLHTQDAENIRNTKGVAQTKYSGLQEIITDSLAADSFRLAETTRGGGIFTFDLNTGTNELNAVDFYDDDNFWNNVNSQQDEAATDAHWGAEMTFDYYFYQHDWEGVDGRGMPLVSYVHYDNEVTNAFWFGTFARFGDGNGMNATALTGLDVVAHEFTHGVTDFTADLRYRNESGALNESFSDIFGAAVEFWAAPDSSDWLMGEDFQFGNYFRNMADPNDKGDPDTYKGEFWATGSADNGGVHTNSGVQNFWFYLLTEGGSGTNDLENDYTVSPLGLEAAGRIAFRNLRYYLTVDSDYLDARQGSLQAAEDLFGACSPELKEVAKAWYAVGVGAENTDNDFRVTNVSSPDVLACGLTDREKVAITITLNGCQSVEKGALIPVAYQVDQFPIIYDTLITRSDLLIHEKLRHAFRIKTAALEEPGKHILKAWTAYPADSYSRNDTLIITVENIIAQNSDVSMASASQPASGCFLSDEPVSVRIGFHGCDSLAEGTRFDVYYQLDTQPAVRETLTLPYTLYRGDILDYTFSKPAQLMSQGRKKVSTWVDFEEDFLHQNDSLSSFEVLNAYVLPRAKKLTFEGGEASLDSFHIKVGQEAEVEVQGNILQTAHVLRMTGGDFWKTWRDGNYVLTDSTNVWAFNEAFRGISCICVDLTDMTTATLQFDLKQTYSPEYLDRLHREYRWASAMRVLINEEQVGPDFFPKTPASDLITTREINLDDYVGSTVEICFESRCASNKANDPANLGDNVLLDNVYIGEQIISSVPVVEARQMMTIFPNPASEFIEVNWKQPGDVSTHLEIYNMHGVLVTQIDLSDMGQGRQSYRVATNDLQSGPYVYRFAVGKDLSSGKLLIIH